MGGSAASRRGRCRSRGGCPRSECKRLLRPRARLRSWGILHTGARCRKRWREAASSPRRRRARLSRTAHLPRVEAEQDVAPCAPIRIFPKASLATQRACRPLATGERPGACTSAARARTGACRLFGRSMRRLTFGHGDHPLVGVRRGVTACSTLPSPCSARAPSVAGVRPSARPVGGGVVPLRGALVIVAGASAPRGPITITVTIASTTVIAIVARIPSKFLLALLATHLTVNRL